MTSKFPGFPPETLTFFRGLAKHNDREWFQARKSTFDEHVKGPMRQLVEQLNSDLRSFAPEFVTDPDKAVYRIYRDTRFSADKTPYKTHIAASFRRRGAGPHQEGGFYVQVSHENVGIGGGAYHPEPLTLFAIRQHIAEHHEEFRKIISGKAIKDSLGEMWGEQLKRVPKGFLATHPAADLLRFKSFIFYNELPVDLATSPELYGEVLRRFKAMKPFLDFLTAPQRKASSPPRDAW